MHKIAVLPGDGIGREITPEAVRVLKLVGEKYGLQFEFTEGLIGGAAIDAVGVPLPEDTIKLCKESAAVLLGAVGGPKWDSLPVAMRPEVGALLPLRKELGLFGNFRPCFLYPSLTAASSLKEEIVQGIDLLVVRELTGGLYFGDRKRERISETEERAYDTMLYTTSEIERIVELAFKMAQNRKKKVTSVDKANVLESSRLWRDVAIEVGKRYPDIELEHMYVDNCAMQLVKNPRQFDVIVTENMFGDILTDQASMLSGSIGMLASASIGGKTALYEPAHGSAPDIAGQNKANPLATILSAALLLRHSFECEQGAAEIENAISTVLDKGYRTGDIYEDGKTLVGTREMGELVLQQLTEGK